MAKQKRRKMRIETAAITCAIAVVALAIPLWMSQSPAPSDALVDDQPTAVESVDEQATPDDEAAKEERDEPSMEVEEFDQQGGTAREIESGVVLAQLPEGKTADEVNAALTEVDAVASPNVTQDDIELGWAQLTVADGVSVSDARRQLEESGLVDSAQPNYVYRLNTGSSVAQPAALATGTANLKAESYTASVNDPMASSQWALEATKADQAYKYVNDTLKVKSRATIAILDTGCYYGHSDLDGNIIDRYDAVSNKRPTYTNKNFDIDPEAHGTHVAGIASAEVNNGTGIAGMGGNSKLLPILVFKQSGNSIGASSVDIARGFSYIIKNASKYNIKVVNMSLGSDLEKYGVDARDRAVMNKIDTANSKGILTVAAAGNDADNYGYRAYRAWPTYSAETSVGVISLGNKYNLTKGVRTSWSNYNKAGVKVNQLGAPGCKILSANDGWMDHRRNGTTYPRSTYVEMDGTSMASPCIAGITALVWATNPKLTPDQMKSVLYSTAQDIGSAGFDLETGFGCIDALAAVKSSKLFLAGKTSAAPGKSVTLKPSSTALSKATAAGKSWTWTSSSPAVATVKNGKVTGKAAGATVITATAGSIKLKQIVTVHKGKISGAASLTPSSSKTYTIKEPYAENGTWTWTSSNTKVATVNKTSGTVTAKRSGKTTLTAKLTTNPNVKVTKTIKVGKTSVSKLSISVKSPTYNGKKQKAKVTVKLNGSKVALSNFKVTYSNNKNAGSKAKVTLTAKSSSAYTGKVTKRFTIKKASIKTVKLSTSSYSYNGKKKSPRVTVKGSNGLTLKAGRDFNLKTPGGRVKVGTYKYVVTGKGNYKGTKTAKMKIVSGGSSGGDNGIVEVGGSGSGSGNGIV